MDPAALICRVYTRFHICMHGMCLINLCRFGKLEGVRGVRITSRKKRKDEGVELEVTFLIDVG